LPIPLHFPKFVQNLNLKLPNLKPGDKVAIIATSGRVFESELEENLQFLRSLELIPVFGKNLFQEYFEGYFYAGTPNQRLQDLQDALDNPDIKAIWCARGGYGAVHLLDELDWSAFQKTPKWIIGYSDITALHNHINNWNIPSLHAITVKRLNVSYTNESFSSLKSALIDGELSYDISAHAFNRIGNSQGKLVGGNLSLIYSLMGTPSELKGEDLILFIEDWNENWYHLDRMLMNLKRNGLLDRIKGLIVGSFTRMDTEEENENFLHDYDETSYQIIHKFMKDYSFPICFQFPAGHTGDNRALVLGNQVKLEVSENTTRLEFI
jgi:muramoyltetrapeptide carboxypeptidase